MPHSKPLTGEFDYIAWIRQRVIADSRVPIGIGDDAALVRFSPNRDVIVTTDMLLEGVHFDLQIATPYQVGRKALGVNLSDIAAMAGIPVAATVALGVTETGGLEQAEELFRGIHEMAAEFNVAIVGGDTNRSRDGLVISITLLGEAGPHGCVKRGGARAGDWILTTGSLGGSIRAKHLTFIPRVREAAVLHDRYHLHSMIDLSDGLAADLGHVLEESACGAVLQADSIPINDLARIDSGTTQPLEHALYDGEDFELVFTLGEGDARRLLADQPLDVPVTHIGVIVESGEYLLQLADGSTRPVERRGYDHFRR
jgi:thiamine-monophosphate kinase